MSHENVEVVKRASAALNAGDIEAALQDHAADATLRDLANGPDQASVVEGADAIRQAWTLWTDAFDELRVDIEEFIDAGNAVICAARWHGHGKASGISIDLRQFDVFEFSDGKIVRMTFGLKSKEEALQAAGREH
jgi:ketosteroid isomerase-like protein